MPAGTVAMALQIAVPLMRRSMTKPSSAVLFRVHVSRAEVADNVTAERLLGGTTDCIGVSPSVLTVATDRLAARLIAGLLEVKIASPSMDAISKLATCKLP